MNFSFRFKHDGDSLLELEAGMVRLNDDPAIIKASHFDSKKIFLYLIKCHQFLAEFFVIPILGRQLV